jgi:hypothetical protein
MKCVMALHDPCGKEALGEVHGHDLQHDGRRVPLCWAHVLAWDLRTAPFVAWTDAAREKWAQWAAARAKRQEARTA